MNKYYIGIDLHSNNLHLAMKDQDGNRQLHKKLPCDLDQVLAVLKPHRKTIKTVAVESTYNWYWLVDGLRENDYPAVLANPAQINQYQGLKQTKDVDDAYWLAEMARLDILPTGYIYDPQLRSVRDLLRRRTQLVHQRTGLIVSFKSLHARTLGATPRLAEVKSLEPEKAAASFDREGDQLTAQVQVTMIGHLDEQIAIIERAVLRQTKPTALYQRLQSIPGIGKILGMTIALETGEIERFPSAGDFASYCRTVDSKRWSNEKVKGRNNGKCGNKYLAWAFVEAAHSSRRYDEKCAAFYEKKKQQRNTAVATKALGCKLAKAAWWIMKEGTTYDARRMFGQ
ncbi:MAG: IS110 family transposase [Alphaproteobacteria bacterium]|nr:MAG: IS110 family transposase [Alphaproteobacteria bacterium]